ncbi:MAG: RNA-binding protein [Firmicutes bacterium]|nr:RNA-binding protein [Bacillota bacterium]
MPEETLLLQKRLLELANKAETLDRAFFTPFLTLAEQDIAARILPAQAYRAWGGFPEAERKILCFGPEAPPPICYLCIRPRNAKFAQALTHRDYLGALLALGVKRQVLGDILPGEDQAFCVCLHSVAGYIAESLQQVNRTSVFVEQRNDLPAYALPRLRTISVSVSSLRLDGLIAAVYHIAREDSRRLCLKEQVFVNSMPCGKPDYMPKPQQIVSVRGYGRFRFLGQEGMSKRGRLKATVDLYES